MKSLLLVVMLVLTSFPVFAQAKYAIKEMTPQVQEALNNRRDRYDQLRDLKAKGWVGENNKGYAEALSEASVAVVLVADENKDRSVIYSTIALQNGLEGSQDTIEKVFAGVQRDKAQQGDKIQDDSGQWITK